MLTNVINGLTYCLVRWILFYLSDPNHQSTLLDGHHNWQLFFLPYWPSLLPLPSLSQLSVMKFLKIGPYLSPSLSLSLDDSKCSHNVY